MTSGTARKLYKRITSGGEFDMFLASHDQFEAELVNVPDEAAEFFFDSILQLAMVAYTDAFMMKRPGIRITQMMIINGCNAYIIALKAHLEAILRERGDNETEEGGGECSG